MAVLLSYNEADSWTVANLVKATQIKEDLLVQVSRSSLNTWAPVPPGG